MKYVLHSVSYAGLWRGQKYLSLEEFIKKAACLGYDGVEIMAKRPHASILEMDADCIKRLDGTIKENNLECACIAGYTDFTLGIDSGLVPTYEMQVSYVTQLAQMAHGLDCSIVRVFTGYENRKARYAQQWDACVKALKECAKRAGAYGVNIGIQNHHDIAVDAISLNELINEIGEPNCFAMLDAWSPALQGRDLADEIRKLSGRIIFTTAADYIRIPRYNYDPGLVNYVRQDDMLKAVPMGKGFIDYGTFFKELKASGYDGYAAYEMCSELQGGGSEENLDACAKGFLNYMKTL